MSAIVQAVYQLTKYGIPIDIIDNIMTMVSPMSYWCDGCGNGELIKCKSCNRLCCFEHDCLNYNTKICTSCALIK